MVSEGPRAVQLAELRVLLRVPPLLQWGASLVLWWLWLRPLEPWLLRPGMERRPRPLRRPAKRVQTATSTERRGHLRPLRVQASLLDQLLQRLAT